ncbi:hypothetical protein CHU98_g6776, partial [Xylaria longipes]
PARPPPTPTPTPPPPRTATPAVETFNFEANLAASRSQAAALARRLEENKSRSEELVNDLLALGVSGGESAARRDAEAVDTDETEEEDFI